MSLDFLLWGYFEFLVGCTRGLLSAVLVSQSVGWGGPRRVMQFLRICSCSQVVRRPVHSAVQGAGRFGEGKAALAKGEMKPGRK